MAAIRADHPDILLSVDANAAYTLEDLEVFRTLDAYDLLMVEQPLHNEDLVQHAGLQAEISTADLPGRVDPVGRGRQARRSSWARAGSSTSSRAALAACSRPGGCTTRRHEADMPVWCGGMLETGVGRATNLALAGMPNFLLPGDTSASARYFDDDLTEPFILEPDGSMLIPTGPGIGVVPRPDRLEACTVRRELLRS